MNVLYFLKERTRLIHYSYEQASQPFNDIIRKIEAEKELFILPYSKDLESSYLAECSRCKNCSKSPVAVACRCCLQYCISILGALEPI